MAYPLRDNGPVSIAAAALHGMVANTYYWIDRQGNLTTTGQATLAQNTALNLPTDQVLYDVSMGQALELIINHGVLPTSVGGTIAVAEVQPDFPQTPIAFSSPLVVGTPVTQPLAATAESLRTAVVGPYGAAPAGRLIKVALAILFTTVATAGPRIKLSPHAPPAPMHPPPATPASNYLNP